MNAGTLSIAPQAGTHATYRFEMFKGVVTEQGRIEKHKTLGAAVLLEGRSTYTVYLNTFINEVYYLLPGEPRLTTAEYVLMSRQSVARAGKKFIWRPVGEGRIVRSEGVPLLHLKWDLFGESQIYMKLTPVTQNVESAMVGALREVLKA
jgi:hypothetical protein